jgi:hypothetical protein
MEADGDNQPVAQARGRADHIDMAIGDGIEGARVERDALHEALLSKARP